MNHSGALPFRRTCTNGRFFSNCIGISATWACSDPRQARRQREQSSDHTASDTAAAGAVPIRAPLPSPAYRFPFFHSANFFWFTSFKLGYTP